MERMARVAAAVFLVVLLAPHASSAARAQGAAPCNGEASVETLGLATAGTLGLLRLEMSGAPQHRSPFHLRVAGALPLAPGFLTYGSPGAGPSPLPFVRPGAAFAILPFVALRNGNSPPLLRLDSVPASLCGTSLVAQGFAFDAQAIGGVAATKEAHIEFGQAARGPLFPTPLYDFPGDQVGVAVADLDGDGIQDCVLAGESGAPDLTVFVGLGNGSFSAAGTYEGPARDPVLADFDGDQVLDVAFLSVGSASTTFVHVLRGLGGAVFDRLSSFVPTGHLLSHLAGGDLDGDGIADLVVADKVNELLTVYLGSADGTFTMLSPISVPGWPNEVALADLNGDLVLDIAVAMQLAAPWVRFGAGDGTFPTASPTTFGGWNKAWSLVVGDFDGDEIPDLAFGGQDELDVYLGTGAGSFGPVTTFPTGPEQPSSNELVDLVAADLDLDGDLDLVAANNRRDRIDVLSGQGDGTFALGSNPAAGNGLVALAAGDFDGDSAPDLAVAVAIDNAMLVFSGRGDGSFVTNVDTPVSGDVKPTARFAVGDVNGDQVVDVAMKRGLTSISGQDQVLVWFGAQDGSFALQQTLANDGKGGGRVELVDMNGDFAPEIVALNQSPGSGSSLGSTIAVFENQGNGTFSSAVLSGFGSTGWSDLELADLNGDEVLDVVAIRFVGISFPTTEYAVLMGLGGGAFGPPQVRPIHGPTDLALGDVDKDHLLDLVVVGEDTQGFGVASVLLGHGDGGFGPVQPIDIGVLVVSAISAKLVDLDGDRALDLVLVKSTDFAETYSIVRGNGDGTFGVPQTNTGTYGVLVDVRDMNADERLDLVLDGPAVAFGKKDGTFAPMLSFLGPGSRVADVDGDLLPDLVGLSVFPPKITFVPGLLLPE